MSQKAEKNIHKSIFISVLGNLSIGFLYFIFRAYDRTTLVNWNWIFHDIGVWQIYAVFLGASLVSLLAWLVLSERTYHLFILIATALTMLYITKVPEVVPDITRYFIQAKYLGLFGPFYFLKNWGSEIPAWTDLPLGSFLYGLGFWMLGEKRLWIQVLNILLLCGGCILTYKIGGLLWDRKSGLFSGLLLLSGPYLLIQVPMMLVDLLCMTVFTMLLYLCISVRKPREYILLSLATTAATLAKYSLWLFVPIFVLPFMVLFNKKGKGLWQRLSALLYGYVLALLFLLKNGLLFQQIKLLTEFQIKGLGQWREPSLGLFFFHIHPLFFISVLLGLYLLARQKHRFYLLVLSALVLTLLINRGRYILPLLPVLALSGGYAIARIPLRLGYFITGISVITSLFTTLLYVSELDLYSPSNLKEAAHWLNKSGCREVQIEALTQKNSMGQTAPMVAFFDLYYSGEIISVKPWKSIEEIFYHPLLFTWKIKRPLFYPERPFKNNIPTLLIASHEEDLKETRWKFLKDTGHFRYKSLVGLMEQGCSQNVQNKNPIVPNGTDRS